MAFALGGLHVDSSEDGSVLRERWTGRANELKHDKALDGYFAPLIDRALATGLSIEHHFEELEYFNSSFISWVIRHLRRTTEAKVKTAIYFEPKSSMHRSSFEALRILQTNNPYLEVLEARPLP
jgi:hypothetical protein